MALLAFTIDRLEAYAAVSSPSGMPEAARMPQISAELEAFLKTAQQDDLM